jgi:hypothetical protein
MELLTPRGPEQTDDWSVSLRQECIGNAEDSQRKALGTEEAIRAIANPDGDSDSHGYVHA